MYLSSSAYWMPVSCRCRHGKRPQSSNTKLALEHPDAPLTKASSQILGKTDFQLENLLGVGSGQLGHRRGEAVPMALMFNAIKNGL
ncbi:MAG TPA: hypothetical protein V6D11_20315 [Waterburya sp.]